MPLVCAKSQGNQRNSVHEREQRKKLFVHISRIVLAVISLKCGVQLTLSCNTLLRIFIADPLSVILVKIEVQ